MDDPGGDGDNNPGITATNCQDDRSDKIAALSKENQILKAKNEQIVLENKVLAAGIGKHGVMNMLGPSTLQA